MSSCWGKQICIYSAEIIHVGIDAVEKNILLILDIIIITQGTGGGVYFGSMSLSQNVGCEHEVLNELYCEWHHEEVLKHVKKHGKSNPVWLINLKQTTPEARTWTFINTTHMLVPAHVDGKKGSYLPRRFHCCWQTVANASLYKREPVQEPPIKPDFYAWTLHRITHVSFSRHNSSWMPIRSPKIYHSKRTNTINTNIPSRRQCSAQKTSSLQQHTPHGALSYTTPSHHNDASCPSTLTTLRYSQRSSNLSKRSHDSVGSMPIPSPSLPQTTAIECLNELAPTTQLAAPPQNQPAKRAWQTQSAPPYTNKKRKHGQTVSQQHLLNTQNLFPSIG